MHRLDAQGDRVGKREEEEVGEDGTAVDVYEALLERAGRDTPWGLELRGGSDVGARGQPIRIGKITPGSPAARIGLKSGDEVTEIGDSSTQGLTYGAALDIISHYGQSLILTVERRARGSVPVHPVMNPNQPPPLKGYQTYDMSGGQRPPRYPPQANVQFHTAESRPFEEPVQRPYVVPPQPQPQPQPQTQPQPAPLVPEAQPYTPPQPQYQQPQVGMQAYIPPHPTQAIGEDDLYNAPQSRTFKILQGLMENEAEPPPVMFAKRPSNTPPSGPGVFGKNAQGKAIMNKQFNTPIGMYAPDTIADTLEGKMEAVHLEEKTKQSSQGKESNFTPSGVKKYNVSETWRLVQEMDEEDKLKKTMDLSRRRPSGQVLSRAQMFQAGAGLANRRSSDGSLPAYQPAKEPRFNSSQFTPGVASIQEDKQGSGSRTYMHSRQQSGIGDSGYNSPLSVVSQESGRLSAEEQQHHGKKLDSSNSVHSHTSNGGSGRYTTSVVMSGLGSNANQNGNQLVQPSSGYNENCNNNNNNDYDEEYDSDEEPYAGTAGLPPPRSASGERWREEQMDKRRPVPQHPAGPRVKVFMPQQYNSPLGMYSAQNVVETFQNQAEMQMQELESHHDDPVSGAQRAVHDDEFQIGGAR